MEEKLLTLKVEIKKMEELWTKKQNEQAFQLFLAHMSEVNEFLLWIDRERVIDEDAFQSLVKYLFQAIENRDSVLLEDVVQYALLDMINQLLGEEE